MQCLDLFYLLQEILIFHLYLLWWRYCDMFSKFSLGSSKLSNFHTIINLHLLEFCGLYFLFYAPGNARVKLLFAIFQHSLDHFVSFFVMLYKISPFIMQFSLFKKLHVFVRLVGVLYSNSLFCPPISFLKVGVQKYLSIYNLYINPSIDLSIYCYIYYSNLTEVTWIYYIYLFIYFYLFFLLSWQIYSIKSKYRL